MSDRLVDVQGKTIFSLRKVASVVRVKRKRKVHKKTKFKDGLKRTLLCTEQITSLQDQIIENIENSR